MAFASPSKENSFSELLKSSGIETFGVEANDSRFDEWIATADFDIIVFDRFVIEEQFGWRVQDSSPRSMRVLDTQDLHFLRRARHEATQSGLPLNWVGEDLYRELAAIYRCDLTLVISDFELGLLKRELHVPDELLTYFTLGYPAPEPSPEFSERQGFAVIGNFRHPPNADGTLWLKKEIWPRIRAKLPSAQVHVYGAYPPKEMMNLNSRAEGFFVEGPVEDARTTLAKHRVNLAPLRFGAGIKGKIADGWRAGAPVVATPIGAEGMTLDQAFGGAIAETPEEFAARAVELHENSNLWLDARRKGHEILEAKFSEQKNSSILIQTLEQTRADLSERRKRNITGGMLNYHLLRSTKYFSRWIETKNKMEPRLQS